ncbi:MAG: KilA-N domain-containing protein [Betaproteobacteria bacterium]|nr:KilA-N domain-containing protein [Betaproteobacteria bacterium]
MSPSVPVLAIGEHNIRQHGELFSLNDLHRAAGGEARHAPKLFLRLDQTQELAAEIAKGTDLYLSELSNSANSQNYTPVKSVRGKHGGTYACRELVIAYAAWISAAFHLKVIRVFLAAAAPVAAPASLYEMLKGQHLQFKLTWEYGEMRIEPLKGNSLPAPAVAPLPRLEFPRPPRQGTYKYDKNNPYPRDGRTIEIAQEITAAIRDWAEKLPDPQARDDLRDAAHTLYELLVTGWTEVDEALGAFLNGMHYLNRWQGRGGRCGNVE